MAKDGEEPRSFAYDVFLSFRGEDTRHNFMRRLHEELKLNKIKAFLDDNNLRIGKDLSSSLSKAIEESNILIIVFSQNYASSTWCLNELVKILECAKTNSKQLAFPIFYHVDPSDIRKQRKSYGEAMIAHEKKFGKDSKEIQAWRSALSEAANLKGHHIDTGSEIDIENIIKEVYANIAAKPFHVGEDPVGLEHRIEEVKSLLNMEPNDDTVCMVGIYGLGGIGKTELAKALYNNIFHQFEAVSFLANVREKSNKINGLEDLQKTLLSEMLKKPKTKLSSAKIGIDEIKSKLGKKKVLLVLDDVDDRKQLKNLAGECDWFGSGSRIIITTRGKDLLIGHQVQKMYEMTKLNDLHSLKLFCQNAFKKSHPETGYEDMSTRAVGYAKHLPLALKVIGSNLATQNSLEAWEDALEEYERIPRRGIQDVLKVSYDKLEPNAQIIIFLDIACFFKGERKEYVENILNEYSARFNIGELVNRSLLTVEHGSLEMHDLIQDMGREIVRQEAPNPGKRSRLWFYKDIIEVLADDSGSDAIQGIMLNPPQHEDVEWSGIAFKKMKWLRILTVQNTSFSSEPEYLPNHLRLLDWVGYPSKSFPPNFHPEKIIVFNLIKSQLTMEEPFNFKKFSCMTNMDFSHNESITVMPDVSAVKKLRELRLDNCKNLIEIHESVGSLKNLAHLSAWGCTKLRKFPLRMYLPSLEVLDLNLCPKLEHFPDIVDEMKNLLKIYMTNTSIKELPNSIGKLTGLDCIEISSSKKLRYLPSELFTLPKIATFKIGGCSQLQESFRRFLQSRSAPSGRSTLKTLHFENGGLSDEDLRAILFCFPKLEELIASKNNFVSLPPCIKESVHLTSLDVSVCLELQKIPECNNLKILIVHQCVKLEHISELPATIQKVDARYCYSLTRETSDMLWHQVKKERHGLEIVMPQTKIPEWFDYSGKEGNLCFWVRGKKFPIIALALVFKGMIGRARQSRRQLVELRLVINGQCVTRKGYYNFRIEENHVLVCDLRLLFSDEEWLGLDAYLEHEWNHVQVSYEAPSTVTLSCWGVYVYKQETNYNMDDVQPMCPNPKYSYLANISPATVPTTTRDPDHEQRKYIEKWSLDEMFPGVLRESMDIPDEDYAKMHVDDLMRVVKPISEQAKDVLEGKALDKKSPLAWVLGIVNKSANEEDEMEPPMDVGEASTSGLQGSSEVQDSDPQLQEIMTEIFTDGMVAGLLEAQSIFPSLDVDTTMRGAAKNKGKWVRFPQPESEVKSSVETEIYMDGIIIGLLEAKLSFPTLDIVATLNTVLSKGAYNRPTEAPPTFEILDWTKVMVPSSEDPLLQAFKMMKQESCESEAKSKLYWKLMEEHKALRKKFEELQNETAAPDKDRCLLPSVKNQYDELIQKLNTQSAQFISNRCHNLDGTALSSTGMHTDILKEGCKGVTRTEKLAAVLKGRAEELRRLYDAGIEGFHNSEEFQDLMSAVYLNGLKDGLLEAQVTLLALDMDRITPVFKENDEHATHEAAIDEHVTAEAAGNENPDETIGVVDIPSPTAPEVANPWDTSNPSGSEPPASC